MKASENSPTLGIISRSSKDAVLAEILELPEAEKPNGEAVEISGWPNGCDTYCRSKAPKKKTILKCSLFMESIRIAHLKSLFGVLSKGSSFLKKWMFKSMKLNSIIWSQSYNWGSMYVQDYEWTSLSPKKVRQWCQNKTKTSYPPKKN